MRNIIVKELNQTYIEDIDIEIVERKGIGHPDSISDGIGETVSEALCKMYMDELGGVLHHNTDEVQITAGESNPVFGGGKILKPIDILLTGRGVSEYDGIKFPLDRVAIEAAKNFLDDTIINLDVELDTVVECKIGHGSGDLVDVFKREGAPSSNDTSFGVGYAPFSETETLVKATEELLNSKPFKAKHPAVGEDIKKVSIGKGCPYCNNTGYKGRIAVHEIILIDGTVRRMISRKAEIDEIKEYLNLEQGLETLQDQAVQLVKDGITTVAELNKIKVYSD